MAQHHVARTARSGPPRARSRAATIAGSGGPKSRRTGRWRHSVRPRRRFRPAPVRATVRRTGLRRTGVRRAAAHRPAPGTLPVRVPRPRGTNSRRAPWRRDALPPAACRRWPACAAGCAARCPTGVPWTRPGRGSGALRGDARPARRRPSPAWASMATTGSSKLARQAWPRRRHGVQRLDGVHRAHVPHRPDLRRVVDGPRQLSMQSMAKISRRLEAGAPGRRVSEGMGRWFLWRKPGEMGVRACHVNR